MTVTKKSAANSQKEAERVRDTGDGLQKQLEGGERVGSDSVSKNGVRPPAGSEMGVQERKAASSGRTSGKAESSGSKGHSWKRWRLQARL